MTDNTYITTTFYKFFEIKDLKDMQLQLYKACNDNKILGTILLANEGINASLSGSREAINIFYNMLKRIADFSDVTFKETIDDKAPFAKLKVKIKDEIIKFGINQIDAQKAGERVDPEIWEELLDNGATLIDCRNDYEVAFGTFKNAVNPQIRKFTDLPQWIDKNLSENDLNQPIAMFCTAGIRCEKSTAYLLHKGFKKVYHLNGGIIEYLKNSENKNQYWQGNCFVFDDRIAVDANLKAFE